MWVFFVLFFIYFITVGPLSLIKRFLGFLWEENVQLLRSYSVLNCFSVCFVCMVFPEFGLLIPLSQLHALCSYSVLICFSVVCIISMVFTEFDNIVYFF